MRKVRVAIIGGTQTESMLDDSEHVRIRTPYGLGRKTVLVPQQVLRETAINLPEKRHCQCAHALKEARIQG